MLSNKTLCSDEDMVAFPPAKYESSSALCAYQYLVLPVKLAILASFRVLIQKFGEHINVNGKLFLLSFKKGS